MKNSKHEIKIPSKKYKIDIFQPEHKIQNTETRQQNENFTESDHSEYILI
jgi:hypothetical protein